MQDSIAAVSSHTPLLATASGSNNRSSQYSAITQNSSHTAISIDDPRVQPPLPPLRTSLHALQGGALGGVVGIALGYAASLLGPHSVYGDPIAAAGVATATLLGIGGGAAARVRIKVNERNVSLSNEIRAHCDNVCRNWANNPGKIWFSHWFDRMTDPADSTEFVRRPQFVMTKLRYILDAADKNPTLRLELQQIASNTSANCHDRVSVGMFNMLSEIHITEMLDSRASSADFIEQGKKEHRDTVLKQVSAEIAANPGPEPLLSIRPDNFHKESLELYMYFAQRLGEDLKLTDIVEHADYAEAYGKTCGFSVDEVRTRIDNIVNQENAFQDFMKSQCASWRRHLVHEKPSWFETIDTLTMDRFDDIDRKYKPGRPGPSAINHDKIKKEMHRELAASERNSSRRNLIAALTDHYFLKNELDSFDFTAWMAKDEAAYREREQNFLERPEEFGYLRKSPAGMLIG